MVFAAFVFCEGPVTSTRKIVCIGKMTRRGPSTLEEKQTSNQQFSGGAIDLIRKVCRQCQCCG